VFRRSRGAVPRAERLSARGDGEAVIGRRIGEHVYDQPRMEVRGQGDAGLVADLQYTLLTAVSLWRTVGP
jgi:hypothetical protein